MKRLVVAIVLALLPCLPLFGQCKKDPGQNGNFTWVYAVADEPKASGFRWYSSPIQSGPFNNLVASVASAQARQLTAPVNFATGTVKTFYIVRAYFTSAGGTVESGDSASVECERNVPIPTNPAIN
jgi:hypothetical protein